MTIESGSLIIPTFDGFSLIVSGVDAEGISKFRWRTFGAGNKKYARASINGRRVLLHRFLLGLEEGDTEIVDHINGNPLDNRRENLRICSARENSWNRRVTNSLTGFHGVSYQGGKYLVKFTHDEEVIYLGSFNSAVQAAHEYNKKIVELRGNFAAMNKIDPADLVTQLEIEASKLRAELEAIEGEINGIRSQLR